MSAAEVLVVDPSPAGRKFCEAALVRGGHPALAAADMLQALKALGMRNFSLVVASDRVPEPARSILLKHVRTRFPKIPFLVTTSTTEADDLEAPEPIYHFRGPLSETELLAAVRSILAVRQTNSWEMLSREETVRLFCRTRSPKMAQALEMALSAACIDCPVIIYGETGTGKELCARTIHMCSARSQGPMLAVNCTAIPEGLLESQLFGHKRGAFTGAYEEQLGFFRAARNGTLFLDEIGDLPLGFQAKLLRVVERKEVIPVGGTRPEPTDARLLFATARDLRRDTREGRFRLDLYYRLNVFPVFLPPLRERREDIPDLAQMLLKKCTMRYGKEAKRFSSEALERLKEYDWPGNVRELCNLVELLVLTEPDSEISGHAVKARLAEGPAARPLQHLPPLSLKRFLREQERAYIEKILRANQWNVSRAARVLEISRNTLHRKIAEANLKPPRPPNHLS